MSIWEEFSSLPGRIFLDSSTLQAIYDYGGAVFENEPIPPDDRLHAVPQGAEKVEALRNIFLVNERAHFQFALSDHSFREVGASERPGYLRYALDVLDHWLICQEESESPSERARDLAARLDSGSFGYLGAGDRQLIRDAVAFECDAFLTMERRLPKNAPHIQRELGLLVLSPLDYWKMLQPWAALFA